MVVNETYTLNHGGDELIDRIIFVSEEVKPQMSDKNDAA